MAKGKAVIRASARGARRKGYGLRRAGRAVQTEILDEFAGHLAPEATKVTRGFAPRRSGRLERNIRARVRSYGGRIILEVVSTARSDEGFDYLPVTRFGHKQAIIYPRHAKALAFRVGGPGAPSGGKVIVRAWVRGYKPDHDWVELAHDAMRELMDEAARNLGRRIDRRLLTG
jgi:hypothetical protein